jgi:pre-mRNA-splicing factor CDC5/CEF1
MIEARNLIALSNAQTPLLGGENTSLMEGTGFVGATPKHASIQTPNPMATPLRGSSLMNGDNTPFKTPREEKVFNTQRKKSLLQGLSSLPKPRNEWEIKLPDMEDEPAEKEKSTSVDDMSDYEREIKAAAESESKERAARRSLAVQLGLPRPTTVPTFSLDKGATEIEKMLHEELTRLLKHDSVKYPVAGGKVAPGATKLAANIADMEDEFDSKTLVDARKELDAEIINTLGLSKKDDIKKAIWDHVSSKPDFEQKWDQEHEDLLFSAKFNRFMTLNEMDDEKDIIQGLDKTVEVKL